MTSSRKGLLLINTGPGKGKTTAAMGTALRAVGNGMRVLMLQFLKGSWHYGELDAVQAFGQNFVLKQMGRGFVKVGGADIDGQWQAVREAGRARAITILGDLPIFVAQDSATKIGRSPIRWTLPASHDSRSRCHCRAKAYWTNW